MGTGDRSDSTTDFFDTHKAQCTQYARVLRSIAGTEALVSELDASIALCDTAIAKGRRRTDGTAAVAKLAPILTRYASLSTQVKASFLEAVKLEAVKPTDDGSKP